MRAWQYAQRHGYHDESVSSGHSSSSSSSGGAVVEQFLSIAAAEGLEIVEKPVARDAVRHCLLLGFLIVSPSVWMPAPYAAK